MKSTHKMKAILGFALFISTLISKSLLAQNVDNRTSLCVDGSAKIKLKPDVSVIQVSLVARDSLESKSIISLNEKVESIRTHINSMGISNSSIRIGEYSIAPERIYLASRPEETSLVHIARNTLIIEIPSNLQLIDSFYQSMAKLEMSETTINIQHKISQELEHKTRKNLTTLAIEDAKEQAQNIAKSLNTTLASVSNVFKEKNLLDNEIIYSKKNLAFNTKLNDNISPSPFSKLEINEVELEEKITLVYKLK